MTGDFWATFWLTGIPTWLSGAGTLGLAAFAVWAIRADKSERLRVRQEAEAERLRLRQEAEKERARGDALMKEAAERVERQQRREQASMVAVWIDRVDLHGKDFVSKNEYPMAGWTNAAIVRNNSLLPIYDVEVTFFANGSLVREDNFKLHVVPLVPPQGQKELEVSQKLTSQANVSAGVTFRDANGIRWERDRHGALGEAE